MSERFTQASSSRARRAAVDTSSSKQRRPDDRPASARPIDTPAGQASAGDLEFASWLQLLRCRTA